MDIYTAKHSFVTNHDGVKVPVQQGDTVEAGHWLLETNYESFEPITVTFPAKPAAAAAPAAAPAEAKSPAKA